MFKLGKGLLRAHCMIMCVCLDDDVDYAVTHVRGVKYFNFTSLRVCLVWFIRLNNHSGAAPNPRIHPRFDVLQLYCHNEPRQQSLYFVAIENRYDLFLRAFALSSSSAHTACIL